MESENSPLALRHRMGEELWQRISHREGKGKQDSASSLEKRRATLDSIGRRHGLVPHQQKHEV